MSSSTLFGYTLEERDDTLVITVHGTFAGTVVRYLRDELSEGRGLSLIQRLSPLGPLRGMLMRRSIEEGDDELLGLDEAERGLGTDEIMNQGVDQSLDAFEQEMLRFKAAMGSSTTQKEAAVQSKESVKVRGRKAARRKSQGK